MRWASANSHAFSSFISEGPKRLLNHRIEVRRGQGQKVIDHQSIDWFFIGFLRNFTGNQETKEFLLAKNGEGFL
jgi:hypothetical protein